MSDKFVFFDSLSFFASIFYFILFYMPIKSDGIRGGMQKSELNFFNTGLLVTRPYFSMAMKKLARGYRKIRAFLFSPDFCLPAASFKFILPFFSLTLQGFKK
jgi:hypothetical protein